MVMGPTCGLMLGDLGADVVKIEPVAGDNTRRLLGSGAGYFPMYNRNKRSICVDLKSTEGEKSRSSSWIVPMSSLRIFDLGHGQIGIRVCRTCGAKSGPHLLFREGLPNRPYEHRTALDEVAQMMGGLAYMTGPPGRPLRAGASVIDVQGGMFGALECSQRSRRGIVPGGARKS